MVTCKVYVPANRLSNCVVVSPVKLCMVVAPCNILILHGDGAMDGVKLNVAFLVHVAGVSKEKLTDGSGNTTIEYTSVCLLDKGHPLSVYVIKKLYVPGATVLRFHEKVLEGAVVLLFEIVKLAPVGMPDTDMFIVSPS